MVLVLAVLVLLALGTVSSGLLFVSTQEALIARAGEEALRARTGAESAVRAAIGSWRTRVHRGLALGAVRSWTSESVHGATLRTSIERLAGRLFLVRGEATTGDGSHASAGALIRVVGIDELWRTFPAAITSNGSVTIEPGGSVTGHVPAASPSDPPGGPCPEAPDSLDAIFGGVDPPALIAATSTASGGAPTAGAPQAADRIGPFPIAEVRGMADRIEAGTVAPAPRSIGAVCDTSAAGNWGAPFDRAHACGGYLPLIYAPGEVEMAGGAGQGVLVVDGDLVLSGGAQFVGAVYASGSVEIRDSAAVIGALTAAGGSATRVGSNASVSYGACSLWAAFVGSPAFDRPFAPAGRSWIPLP